MCDTHALCIIRHHHHHHHHHHHYLQKSISDTHLCQQRYARTQTRPSLQPFPSWLSATFGDARVRTSFERPRGCCNPDVWHVNSVFMIDVWHVKYRVYAACGPGRPAGAGGVEQRAHASPMYFPPRGGRNPYVWHMVAEITQQRLVACAPYDAMPVSAPYVLCFRRRHEETCNDNASVCSESCVQKEATQFVNP